MHDLHLGKACQFKPWQSFTKEAYSFPKICAPVASAFTANITMAHGILMLPGHAFMGGMNWQKCVFAANEHFFGSEEITDEHFNRKQEALSDYAAHLRKKTLSDKSSDQSIREFFNASYNLEVFAKENASLHGWIHDLLKSSLIQTWTAYEVLASDLWRRVDAKRPELGAARSSKEKGLSGFKSRSRIADAYRYTFKVDNADILATVDNTAIHALGELRNVFVHSGGRIDKWFKDHRAPYPELKKNQGSQSWIRNQN